MISPILPALPHLPSPAAPESVSRTKRNVADSEKYWPQGATLKVAMYGASDAFIETVKSAAEKWLPHINLKFDFVSGSQGDIRIAQTFTSKQGSSAIGTDAQKVPADEPTLLLPHDHQDPRFAYVVTHEFGHVLGALHAHQHPDTEIPWNRPRVYLLYSFGLGKSRTDVDEQILPKPRKSTYHYEPYDRHSIMHYDINKVTTDGKWEQPESPQISAGDIALVSKAYPRMAHEAKSVTSPAPDSPRSYPAQPALLAKHHRRWRDADSDCTTQGAGLGVP